jgi:hypothetical protein
LSSWDPAAGHPGICYFHPFLVRFPRPISLHQERQMTTATQNPGEVLEIRIKQKNPSDATSKTIQPRASNITKTSAPASTLFLLARFRFILPVAAEGSYRLLRQFIREIATVQPTVNAPNALILQARAVQC